MRNPPILISVLGFFAMLAGFGFFFFGLRVLGFDWFGIFGDLPKYESAGLWAGWRSASGSSGSLRRSACGRSSRGRGSSP